MIQEPIENEAAPSLEEYTYQDILKPLQPQHYSPSFNELQHEMAQKSPKLSMIHHAHKESIPGSKGEGSLISFAGFANNSQSGTRNNLKSSGAGGESVNTDEFVKQLSQKVRKQAERLMQLETYRELCEKRIKEFAPEHPIPVLESHLGSKKRWIRAYVTPVYPR